MVTIAIASSTSTGVAVGETARSSVDGADGPSSVSVDAEQVAAACMASNATSSAVDATPNAAAEFNCDAYGGSDDNRESKNGDGAESDNDEDLDNGGEFDGFDGY